MMKKNAILIGLVVIVLVALWMLNLFFKISKQHKKKGKRFFRLLVGNGLILLCLGSLAALGGEIYFRFLYDSTDSFGLARTARAWFDKHYHYNQAGFRDSIEYVGELPSGRRRITFVGDSYTIGHGIEDVEKRFANRIRSTLPNWQVHVFAFNGYDTGDELNLLYRTREWNYDLDCVVLVYVLNDIEDVVPEWQAIEDKARAAAETGFFTANSFLLNTLHARFMIKRDLENIGFNDMVTKAYNSPLWEKQKERLVTMRDFIRDQGGQLLVVTFPSFQGLGPDYPFQEIHQRLGAFFGDIKVPHIDLLPMFAELDPGALRVSTHDAHPNEQAHEIASQAMLNFFMQHLSQVKKR